MIATLNKSKTALTINRQEFKLALEKLAQELISKLLHSRRQNRAMTLRKWQMKP